MSYTPLHEQSTGRSSRLSASLDEASEGDGILRRPLSRLASRTPSQLSEPLTANTPATDEPQDPFFIFREDLYRKLELVDEALAEYLRIVHHTDTATNSHDLKEAKKTIKRHLKNAENTLKDVKMTVQVVENDRSKFVHIDDAELYERTSLVQTSRQRLDNTKEEMQSPAIKAKLLADERAKAQRRAGADSLGAVNDTQRHNTNFIIDAQARQSLLMQQQDDTLEELDVAVGRVGDMAGHIHQEIDQQNKMLGEMSDDLDRVEEELGLVMGKLGRFLQTKDKWQLRTILLLALITIVLFLLVLYT